MFMKNTAYERYCTMRDELGYKDSSIAKATGITKSTFSDWKAGRYTPKREKLLRIANFFGVSVDYLITGNEEEKDNAELTARDKRDISKDLDRIMLEIKNGEDGPLYYNGTEIDEKSLILLENAIEHALIETKKENKVKYNPYKNKK